jgi:hypothetical protein
MGVEDVANRADLGGFEMFDFKHKDHLFLLFFIQVNDFCS